MNQEINHKKIGILTVLLFSVIVAISTYVVKYVFGYSYTDPNMTRIAVYSEIILVMLTVFVSMKFLGWKKVGFNKPDFKQLFWITPQIIVLITMLYKFINAILSQSHDIDSTKWELIGIIGICTFLVGIAEELMFRGILLRSLYSYQKASKAILISSISFGLLHSLNILAGLPVISGCLQAVFASFMGLCFAPLALRVNHLGPLIIFHWLWDFLLIGGDAISLDYGMITFVGILSNIIIGIILFKKAKKLDSKI